MKKLPKRIDPRPLPAPPPASAASIEGLDPRELIRNIREPDLRDVRVDMRLTIQEWATVQRLAETAGVTTTRLLIGLADQVDAKLFPGQPADVSHYQRTARHGRRRRSSGVATDTD